MSANASPSKAAYDGNGAPVTDALVELWQADPTATTPAWSSRRSGFRGFGRTPTDSTGHFRFSTIMPGRVPGAGDTLQAPHIAVTVFARGLLKHLVTRIYFPNAAGNAEDPLLNAVPVSAAAR